MIGSWILVLDNLDDDELLRKHSVTRLGSQANSSSGNWKQPPLRHLLDIPDGTIIVTSRNQAVASDVTSPNGIIEVQPMMRAEALALLQKKLDTPETDDTKRLVELLEFMPLAIVQAAAYITNRSPRCSVRQYLEEFQNIDRAMTLLDYEIGHGDTNRDWEANKSILVTWQISFDYVRRSKESATDLLSLMSFFDRQGIPEHLTHSYQNGKYWRLRLRRKYRLILSYSTGRRSTDSKWASADTAFTNDALEEDVEILRQYSFISVARDPKVFQMHRLVQLATLRWLQIQECTEYWKELFIESLSMAFQVAGDENWKTCKLFFPHVKSALAQTPESRFCRYQWATLLYEAGLYAYKHENLFDAEVMAVKARETRTKLFGEWHPETLSSMSLLAITYSKQGRFQEAESLHLRVLKLNKRMFGSKGLDTIIDMGRMATTSVHQGRWREAEKLQMQIFRAYKAKLGEDHPDTLQVLDNIASTYLNQGRWKDAEKLQLRVIEARKAKCGEEYPDTLRVMGNLASTYENQGRYEEAEKLQLQVMETRKIKLGKDHPDTLLAIGNLASTYGNQGRYEEAEKPHLQVMETRKIKLGEDHPDTLWTMRNLAITWKGCGRVADAIILLRDCVAKQKRTLGSKHPVTILSSDTLQEWENEELDGHVSSSPHEGHD